MHQTHVVLLVLVALHDGDDTVVDKEGQSENAGQLWEEQPELCDEKVRISEAARASAGTQSENVE